jgi:hypothetical protein
MGKPASGQVEKQPHEVAVGFYARMWRIDYQQLSAEKNWSSKRI